MMHRFHVYALCLILAGGVQAQVAETDPLEADYNSAMRAFADGKWNEAAEGLQRVVSAVTDPAGVAKLAPVVYTQGAAYFNAGNYEKALEAFKLYLGRYPQAENAIEVRLAAARAMFLSKDAEGAAKLFAQLESLPAVRDEALLAQADCHRMMGQPEGGIPVLEKLISPQVRSRAQARGGLLLGELYLKKKETTKALALLEVLSSRIALVDNIVSLNSLIVQVGDALAEKKNFQEALGAYRRVRTRGEVIAFQRERLAAMERRSQAATAGTAAPGANPLAAELEAAKQLLAELEALPDYWPAVLFRMGSAFYESGQKWESLVVFDRLLQADPDGPDGERALYASLICSSELFRVERTLKLCQDYLRKYPEGANAETVAYLRGVTALQSGDAELAVSHLRGALESQPQSKFRDELRFLLGNAHFMKGELPQAREQYGRYLQEAAQGAFREEVIYRQALSFIYEGKYEEALQAFAAYLKEFPDGGFAADAEYRRMLCLYAASRYDEVLKEVSLWESRYPNNPILGEVLSLQGDAQAGLNRPVQAANAYTRAYRAATSDEVLTYALLEAGAQWRKQGNWAEVSRHFETFVRERPEHPAVVTAMYWIGRAKAREGKADEAKAFLVQNLQTYLNDPRREAVEQLLQQLAQLCVKRPVNGDAAYDPLSELRRQLDPLRASANPTGKARLLYAEIELLPLIKRAEEAPNLWKEIEIQFAPEDLSAPLLAGVGDDLLAKGKADAAAKFYRLLRDGFAKSSYIDSAYVGLGEIALAEGDPSQALMLFRHAVDEIAGAKLKEAMIGQSRAYYELEQYEEAKKGFQTVASFREWRGEATAMAVFYLGEIEAKLGRDPEAIAHYQRVFVAYQKYLDWTGKAYLRCAEAFERLGKRQEAIGHLREMVRNEKLKDTPERKQADKWLVKWRAS